MTDLPIIFNAPMARAIIAGTKTQTRRALKPQPPERVSCFEPHPAFPNELIPWRDGEPLHSHVVPYAPGDRLWVREGYALHRIHDPVPPRRVMPSLLRGVWYLADPLPKFQIGKGRPSIHMPRWASRLTLAVTDVRVERLNDIREEDALAEGCPAEDTGAIPGEVQLMVRVGAGRYVSPRLWFHRLWDELHGPGAWDANPWVVAITFDVHHCNIDAMEKAA